MMGARMEGGNMLDWLITIGESALFCLLLFLWLRWIALERKILANGTWHHLE